ncbi:MAG: HEAT repeat domain-containing protein, partial [Planctomycetota bacterium]|nr:HEAT repeat domain-containing protein [Planctomycetota bacterium]
VGSGPSGLARVPDQGWGELAGAFMLCDFRGGAQWSSIMAVRHEPAGAGFRLVSAEPLIKDLLPTDCDFGPDGTLYISDWVNGWGMTGKGRVFQVAPPGHSEADGVAEVESLLAEGMRGRSGRELQGLLMQPSFDVRLEAQLELVARAVAAPAGSEVLRECVGLLLEVAREARDHPLARLHGIWGAQAVARQRPLLSGIGGTLIPLLEDPDPEVRVQTLRALGELGEPAAAAFVERALLADGRRERAAALRSLATAPSPRLSSVALQRVLEVIEQDAAEDPWLRSEAIHALEAATQAELVELLTDTRPAVRRCAVVALRRRADPELARALADATPEVAAEAARAIHEVPIPAAAPALAAWLGAGGAKAYDHRRAMAAARELHRDEDALAIAGFLQEEGRGARLVEEGLRFLAEWQDPSPVDPVIGSWRPVVGQPLPAEVEPAALLSAARRSGRGALGHWLRLEEQAASEVTAGLRAELARDGAVHEEVRADALRGLVRRGEPAVVDLAEALLADGAGAVAAAALEVLARTDPERAVAALSLRAAEGDAGARQAAVRALATVKTHGADAQLARLLRAEAGSEATSAVALELLEALEGRGGAEVQAALESWGARASGDPLGARAAAVRAGGSPEEGRRIFLEKAEVSCLRCHQVEEQGVSEVGPRLDGVASRLSQSELLQSILEPNAALAEGYQSWIFALTDGTVLVGRLVEDDEDGVVVLDAEGERHELAADEVEARRKDVSAMPADLAEKLSDRELRDLAAFLESLRKS